MNRRRPPLVVRAQAYAQRSPRRYGTVNGLVTGILFGGFMSVFHLFTHPSSSVVTVLVLGAFSGVFFGGAMGVFAMRVAFKEPLPPDTGHARMREARRLVRTGVPGPDPMANQVARQVARSVLAAPYRPKTQGVLCLLALVLSVVSLVNAHTGPGINGLGWLNLAGAALFAFMLFAMLPLTIHQRRRARAFLAAEEDPAP